jgi:outer membrane protein assembly factor BamB
MQRPQIRACWSVAVLLALSATVTTAEDWLQLKYDCRHSGDVSDRSVAVPLGLASAVPLTDAVFTAPVVSAGRVYVVDGAGVATCIDADTLQVAWRRKTRGGNANCNNVSSPAIAGKYIHFGTMAGSYYVLDADNGEVVKEIFCGEPIFSAPVVGNDRVYFATLGSRVYALEPNGTVCWEWDYVKEKLGFAGDRFNGQAWREHKGQRVTTADQFCCTQNVAMYGKTLVVPAGGAVVWLDDTGDRADVRAVHVARTPTLGLSVDERNAIYRQWHRLDNGGRVEVLRLADGSVERQHIASTQTSTRGGLLSFCSVSLRGRDIYRCRPEEDFGFCRHTPGQEQPEYLGGYPSIASPILLRDRAVFGGLDGRLYVVPLSGDGDVWSFETAFGKAISAPAAVCNGRVFFGCDDGYVYVLGPDGKAPLPTKDLGLSKVRSPRVGEYTDPKYDWFTSFGNWANTNVNDQQVQPPLKMKWVRRYAGTTKHFSTCGGGRLYTHTAEGQIFAVEQETGRLLWRRYFPGVFICYTSPLYHQERLLVPQAGLKQCRLRCLDAATGRLLWEAPFTGSPSWNRQLPPIVHEDLAIYAFSSGKYTPDRWLIGHGDVPGFPADQKPLVRAYSVDTGKEVWTRDFSDYGVGGDDAGMCLMEDTLFYSCFFGYRRGRDSDAGKATGITAALEPATGRVLWSTSEHAVHSGCTISGDDGRLYLGGYSPVDGRTNRVWCLDARDGSLMWESEPVQKAIHVVTIGDKFLFTHSQYENGYLIDKETGKIVRTLTEGYKCTRFTFSKPYLFGANMDVISLSDARNPELLSTGPAVDPSQCVGATVSNGRIFYTSHGSGLQMSQVYGDEAAATVAPWEMPVAAPDR